MSQNAAGPKTDVGAFRALTDDIGICFGGDYNPEQWPREIWREDVELMTRAGVNLVTVGVFSWATIEPVPGAREFGWLDEILDLLHDAGIAVDLATPTASPPPWLGIHYPQTLPVDADGVRLVPGSRNQFSPASPVYREKALAVTTDLARRYAHHPAVRMWHVGNEYGQLDYGDEAAREFRRWLKEKYGTVQALNEAWGTAFWSQRYGGFDEILPPRRMPYVVNPTQSLDFRRYSSDQLLQCYTEQRDALREAGVTAPITTNFMGFFPHADYWSWAPEVDVVADDQYPDPASPTASADIALVQDLMRSLGSGRPWMLMEQAVSATSWRPHNLPKTPRRARLDSLQAVARGADGICFFQWRQSAAGSERFHSAMLPHTGADTEVFAGVCRQGTDLRRLRTVAGSRVRADVAMLFDWTSWWAGEEKSRPTDRLRTLDQLQSWYRQLWRRGVAADVVAPGTDLTGYKVVLVPHSYVLNAHAADVLQQAVDAGGQLVVGPFSGVADERGHILQGRAPVLLRELVGVSSEEWGGMPDGPVPLEVTPGWAGSEQHTARIFAEKLRADDAEVRAVYAAGDLAGRPAVTRAARGAGSAWYLGTVVSDGLLSAVIESVLHDADVAGALGGRQPLPDGLEAVRRGPALFLLNHGTVPVSVPGEPGRVDLLTGAQTEGLVAIAPGEAAVLVEGQDR